MAGNLSLNGAKIMNPQQTAVDADSAIVAGGVLLGKEAVFRGDRFLGARIDGQVICEGSTFRNPGGDSLSANFAQIGNGVLLGEGRLELQRPSTSPVSRNGRPRSRPDRRGASMPGLAVPRSGTQRPQRAKSADRNGLE